MLRDYPRNAALSPILAFGLLLGSVACDGEQTEEIAGAPAGPAVKDEPAPLTSESAQLPSPPKPPPPPVRGQDTAEASYLHDTRWAPAAEGKLVLGLDGGEYPPYRARLVRDVQRFLFDSELYYGPETGVLDEQTMEAIAAFQRANGIVQSGVPSPETRDAMRNVRTSDQSMVDST